MKRIVTAVLLAAGVGSVAFAHQGASGIVKQRMEAMSAMKDAMAVVGRMLKGETTFDVDEAGRAADAIAGHAGDMTALFPDTPESRHKVSEATSLVWEEPDRFEELADDLVVAANELSQVAEEGDMDALTGQFRAVGKACSACHEDFRQKK